MIENVKTDLKVFGNHNLLNITAAFYVCKEFGVNAIYFLKLLLLLPVLQKGWNCWMNQIPNIYRDFAHAPSKVRASVEAMKQQFPNRKLVAVLELHTFSSLNEDFMNQYNGALENADEAIVFYSNHALEIKRLPLLNPGKVKDGFGKENCR